MEKKKPRSLRRRRVLLPRLSSQDVGQLTLADLIATVFSPKVVLGLLGLFSPIVALVYGELRSKNEAISHLQSRIVELETKATVGKSDMGFIKDQIKDCRVSLDQCENRLFYESEAHHGRRDHSTPRK